MEFRYAKALLLKILDLLPFPKFPLPFCFLPEGVTFVLFEDPFPLLYGTPLLIPWGDTIYV